MIKIVKVKSSSSELPVIELEKCCRYCKNYSNGECQVSELDLDMQDPLYKVVEEGYLDSTIKETLASTSLHLFKELEYKLLECRVSQKKIKELSNTFFELMEEYNTNASENLEDSIHMCYLNNIDRVTSNKSIENPEEYTCSKWR